MINNERVLTIFEALLIVTGYTRLDLCQRYAVRAEKRLAQNILIQMLWKAVRQKEIITITGINRNAISEVCNRPLSGTEKVLTAAVWNCYLKLMLPPPKPKVNGTATEE